MDRMTRVHDSEEQARAACEAFPRDPKCPEPPGLFDIATAWSTLKAAIQGDPEYAWSWHCNLAVPILDRSHGLLTQRQANEIAADLVQHFFGVDIRANGNWQASLANWGEGFAQNGEG